MITEYDELQRLQVGNERFVSGDLRHATNIDQIRSSESIDGKSPFAIIVSCSDFRVPAEMVFDQDLGDLYVIRVAGNIVAPSLVDSVEFAVKFYGIELVVVLGHSHCSAISATLEELMPQSEEKSSEESYEDFSIVDRVRPSVTTLLETGISTDKDILLERAIRANVLASSNQLRHNSEILERLGQQGKLQIVGAEYSAKTGKVDFFDR